MNLIFMGTPEFAVPALARLVSDGYEIVSVFTQPDKPAGRGNQLQPLAVKRFALAHGLAVHQPAKIKTNDEVRALFEHLSPDACIVAAYGKILPAWMLSIPRLGCINVHASLLPKYRGAAPINWAIANGESETGITIMQMDEGMDTGAILATRAIAIGEEETAPELSARLAQLGADLLSETLLRLVRGEIQPVSQPADQASYAPILKREDGLINWQMTAQEIALRVRAFQPWPATYTTFRSARLMIWQARVAVPTPTITDSVAAATILGIEKTGFTLCCAQGTALTVEEVQIEGKRRMPARDFVNGMRLRVGDRLTDADTNW